MEISDFNIPITTSTGKNLRVVLNETALRMEQQRNEAQAALKENKLVMEDTTPSYEQLHMDYQKILADYYKDTEKYLKEIEELKEERDAFKVALSNVALFVSAGIGEEDTSAKEYAERIKDGIVQMVQEMIYHYFANRSKK
jgi:hypothetical protein